MFVLQLDLLLLRRAARVPRRIKLVLLEPRLCLVVLLLLLPTCRLELSYGAVDEGEKRNGVMDVIDGKKYAFECCFITGILEIKHF